VISAKIVATRNAWHLAGRMVPLGDKRVITTTKEIGSNYERSDEKGGA